MKKILTIFLILLLSQVCFAGRVQQAHKAVIAAKNGAGVALSYLVNQNFEGTGYDNGETWNNGGGSIDPDYSTTALYGSQSLAITEQSGEVNYRYAYTAFTSTSHIYGFFRFRRNSDTAKNGYFITCTDSSGNILFSISNSGNGAGIQIAHGTATATYTIAWNADTQYYIWYEYQKGTGSDGKANLYVSTNSTKPGSANASLSNGTSTSDAGRIYCYSTEYRTQIFDQTLVSTSTIGSL